MEKIIMPETIAYKGKIYQKNIMYSVDKKLYNLVMSFREKAYPELVKKQEAEETSNLTVEEMQELEEAARSIEQKTFPADEVEPRTVKKASVRKSVKEREQESEAQG
jgi:hypothetical protein